MNSTFKRTGDLKEIASYPAWLMRVVEETTESRLRVANHPVIVAMSEGRLKPHQAEAFLANGWPVVEQFPQYMAMNLQKLRPDVSPGHDMARRYLTRNIRVEQNHAEYWVDWAAAYDISRHTLNHRNRPVIANSLSHWCWKSSSADPLANSIAATNYAIEGVTGEWTTLVCKTDTYAMSFPEPIRRSATRWLKLHAQYDDDHPWEALEIIATLLGNSPGQDQIQAVSKSIETSFEYYRFSLDCCL